MSLKLKYLLPLNVVILLIWALHAVWDLRASEKAFMDSEINAIKHLAIGLRVLVERGIKRGEKVEVEQKSVSEMAERWGDLDIMILDEETRVRVATDEKRVGQRWYEPGIARVLSGEIEESWNVLDHSHDGRRAIDVTVAVHDDSGTVRYVVHVARWLDRLLTAIGRQQMRHGLFALLLLIVVGLMANLLTYRFVLRPLARVHREIDESGLMKRPSQDRTSDELLELEAVIRKMIRQIGQHTDWLQRTIVEKQRRLSEVSDQKDDLQSEVVRVSSELQETQEQLIRTERLAAIGQTSAFLAHELRNPLHIVRGTAETIVRRNPEARELVDDIVEEVDKVERLIEELLDYARPVDLRLEEVRAHSILERVRKTVERTLTAQGVEQMNAPIVVEPSREIVWADAVLLERALANLVMNAVEASPPDEPVVLSAHGDGEGGVIFNVIDSGTGIDKKDLSRVLEPLYTSKARGTGLGLPVVVKIADLHRASVTLSSRAEGGTAAVLHLLPRSGLS